MSSPEASDNISPMKMILLPQIESLEPRWPFEILPKLAISAVNEKFKIISCLRRKKKASHALISASLLHCAVNWLTNIDYVERFSISSWSSHTLCGRHVKIYSGVIKHVNQIQRSKATCDDERKEISVEIWQQATMLLEELSRCCRWWAMASEESRISVKMGMKHESHHISSSGSLSHITHHHLLHFQRIPMWSHGDLFSSYFSTMVLLLSPRGQNDIISHNWEKKVKLHTHERRRASANFQHFQQTSGCCENSFHPSMLHVPTQTHNLLWRSHRSETFLIVTLEASFSLSQNVVRCGCWKRKEGKIAQFERREKWTKQREKIYEIKIKRNILFFFEKVSSRSIQSTAIGRYRQWTRHNLMKTAKKFCWVSSKKKTRGQETRQVNASYSIWKLFSVVKVASYNISFYMFVLAYSVSNKREKAVAKCRKFSVTRPEKEWTFLFFFERIRITSDSVDAAIRRSTGTKENHNNE